MSQSRNSGRFTPSSDRDQHTDGIDLGALGTSGLTQHFDSTARNQKLISQEGIEANVILIAHPDGKRLGTRYRLTPGSTLEIGRSPTAEVSMPEVLSISRQHARLRYQGANITLEDLGSTNGTYLNGRTVSGVETLRSGDRFQVGAVHFKFLRERDVEHAYYEAIYDLVTRDGLTDAYNKRKYEEEIEREFARTRRHGRSLSLILVDLDNFKSVNDDHGHLCGDFVLKRVATVLSELLRPEQMFARIGGDEFVIVVPETTLAGARTLAEKLRERVDELDYHYGGIPVTVSCSFGVAELDANMDRAEDLFEAADRALYQAKDGGRDRVIVYRPGMAG